MLHDLMVVNFSPKNTRNIKINRSTYIRPGRQVLPLICEKMNRVNASMNNSLPAKSILGPLVSYKTII